MSEIVKTLLKDVGIDFDTEEPKHNTGNVAFLKEEVPKTRSSGKRSFMSFRRADEEEIKLAHEERHQKELAKIAQESSLLRTIEEEQRKAEIEQVRNIRTNFINKKMSNAFGTKIKIDFDPTRQLAVDNVLPKSFVPEQAYPEPFEEEPLLNKELADFKKKINEHLHTIGFASGAGGGEVRLEFLDDIDRDTAKVNNKFLKYQSSSGKWIGAEAGSSTTVTVTDNESTNEHNAIVFVADADLDGGTVELESDGDLKYNPNSGTVTATTFSGALSGNATTATEATNITAAANNSTDETVYPTFVDGATGTQGLETDTGFTYNPSTGTVTSTTFSGALSGNATTATALATGRTIGMTGDVVWTSASFTGSGNVTGSATIQANSVDGTMIALGSDASGDVMYYNGTNYIRLAKGSDDEVLTLASGLPSWESAGGGGATLTGSTNNTITTVTGSNAFQGEANLTFDGSTLAVTGNLTVSGTTTVNAVTVNVEDAFVFEGSTADAYETIFSVSDPTADRTIVLPDANGQVQVTPPLTLNGTDGSSTDAGDRLVQNTSANDGDQILYEDATSDVIAVFASHGITLVGVGLLIG